MNEAELIEGLKWCLENAKLSGADWEFCERIVGDGFPEPEEEEACEDEEELQLEANERAWHAAQRILLSHGYQRP